MDSLREITRRFDTIDYSACTKFMRNRNTTNAVSQALEASNELSRVFLALLLINKEKSEMLNESDTIDRVLGRLVASLRNRVLRDDSLPEEVKAATGRAKQMFDAWKRRDKDQVLEFLQQRCVATPPEGGDGDLTRNSMLQWIEALGGEEARQSTEARCSRRWSEVRADDLPAFIAQTAERAYWDLLYERVEGGDIEGTLFPLLRDLRRGVEALLAAAPRTREQFQENFDVDWLLERHRNGSLSRQDVGNYTVYVANVVAQLQAPADAAEVNEWADGVRTMAVAESIPMQEYIPSLVPFVREASAHMRTVIERLEALSAQRVQREASRK
ncbi:MAG: hypothetical protein CL450_09180 [Acidimicrobiaceae bacterium]|nr:hypothetical protein [Acidimicrobiaceae bacterium]